MLFAELALRRGTWGLAGTGRFERSAADGKGMRRMFKKSVSITVLVSFLSFIVSSCTGDKLTQPENTSRAANDLERLDEQLSAAPEVRELLEIRNEIVSLALDRGVTSRQLREAVSDAHRSNELLGFSSLEASELQNRIQGLIGSLYGKYPALEQLVAQKVSESECDACEVDRLAASWDTHARALAEARTADLEASSAAGRHGGTEVALAPARAPLTCKWTQLTVGIVLCAVRSGGSLLFYALCSYGVFCGSCDGGMADVICG